MSLISSRDLGHSDAGNCADGQSVGRTWATKGWRKTSQADARRWAVWTGPAMQDQAHAFLSMLDGDQGIEVVRTTDIALDAADSTGALLIAGAQDLSATVGLVTLLRQRCPASSVVCAVSALAAPELSQLVQAGAHDFIQMPSSAAELAVRLRRAAGHIRELPHADPQPASHPSIHGFVYASPACRSVAAKLHAVAACNANLLILGETGTGKEVCAQAVHRLSARAARPWVAVNCGAIPSELIENELFGHARGAYTTAHAARSGLVRDAEGGTLFLDEVDSLPLAAQAKLLRFLQEREYRPVGSNAMVTADVRIIAASNSDLYTLAQQGRFRLDLYFRLNVLNISLPALRERREDISVLALHFLRQFAQEHGRSTQALSASALGRLLAHAWPGNVRELRHVMERAVLLAPGPTLQAADIDMDHATGLDMAVPDHESFSDAKTRIVEQFERHYIEQLLIAHDGNVTHAAEAAKKNRRAFFELIRKHAIDARLYRPLAS